MTATIQQIPSNYLKTGGNTTLFQRLFTNLTWTSIIIYFLIALVLVIIGYYTFKQYTSTKTAFSQSVANDDSQNSNKTANLLLFYVDWCPHCKTAKPEWENLKSEYDGKNINGYTMIFTEHNCTNETPEIDELMNKYKIEGYPTIKLIKDNQVIEYDAKPTKSTMEQFLNTVL